MAITQCIRRCLDAEPASVTGFRVRGGYGGGSLPKGRLSNAWRAEQLRHLASHVSARDGSAWQPGGREHVVELREAGGHGARTLAMERLEGLRRRHRGQAVWSIVSYAVAHASSLVFTYATTWTRRAAWGHLG